MPVLPLTMAALALICLMCLCAAVNRFFVSLKPLKFPVILFLISFALLLGIVAFRIEVKSGVVIEGAGTI
jgi:hypothetical protein